MEILKGSKNMNRKGELKMPRSFSLEEAKEWNRLKGIVEFTKENEKAIISYCKIFCLFEKFYRNLQTENPTYETENGLIKKNPLVDIVKDYNIQLHSCMKALKLAPAYRKEIEIDNSKVPLEF